RCGPPLGRPRAGTRPGSPRDPVGARGRTGQARSSAPVGRADRIVVTVPGVRAHRETTAHRPRRGWWGVGRGQTLTWLAAFLSAVAAISSLVPSEFRSVVMMLRTSSPAAFHLASMAAYWSETPSAW